MCIAAAESPMSKALGEFSWIACHGYVPVMISNLCAFLEMNEAYLLWGLLCTDEHTALWSQLLGSP